MPLIRSIHQLDALRDEWNALADRVGHALLRHDWLASAARAFHHDRLSTVAVMKDGHLAAVAPLATVTIAGVDRLEFVGASTLHEPNGFLYEDGDAHEELVQEVLQLGRPLVLQRLTADSARLVDARRRSRRRGFVVARTTSPSFGVALGHKNRNFFAELPGKLRYDLKRARARADEVGVVSFTTFSPAPDDVDPLIDEVVAVEGSGWKARHHSALASDPLRLSFFRAYAKLAAAAGTLRLFFLRIGEITAAAQMAVEVYERLWVLKIGYNEKLARCSPGLLLTAEAFRYAVARGLVSYEFLGSAENWEQRWKPEPREHSLVMFYPSTLRGCLGASLDIAGAAWRRMMPVAGTTDAG